MNKLLYLLLFIVSFFIGMLIDVITCHAAEHSQIVKVAAAAGKKYKVDPKLILAVIEVESNFNPRATGAVGEVGLMQLHPKFHETSYAITENIHTGTKVLARMRAVCPYKASYLWVNCYNIGPNKKLINPALFPYYKKVMRAYKRNKATRITADVEQQGK